MNSSFDELILEIMQYPLVLFDIFQVWERKLKEEENTPCFNGEMLMLWLGDICDIIYWFRHFFGKILSATQGFQFNKFKPLFSPPWLLPSFSE